jgi:hypothetical protein
MAAPSASSAAAPLDTPRSGLFECSRRRGGAAALASIKGQRVPIRTLVASPLSGLQETSEVAPSEDIARPSAHPASDDRRVDRIEAEQVSWVDR